MSASIVIPDRDEFKIGEGCEIAAVKPFVLRYWETEFPELAPAKSSGGQRTYSRNDVELILRIKELLYDERFTVAGAKKRLAEEVAQRKSPKKGTQLDSSSPDQVERARRAISKARKELESILTKLQ
jgi:DNA-binding transcriptional MerR regulator